VPRAFSVEGTVFRASALSGAAHPNRAADPARPLLGRAAGDYALGHPTWGGIGQGAPTVEGAIVDSQAQLLWGLLFGSIGVGFFVYGKQQRAVVPLACGVALIVFPYFMPNTIALVGVGIALTAVPYFVRL